MWGAGGRKVTLSDGTVPQGSLNDVGILANNIKARNLQRQSGVEFMSGYAAAVEMELGLMGGLEQTIDMVRALVWMACWWWW
jgi:hypothetical protein